MERALPILWGFRTKHWPMRHIVDAVIPPECTGYPFLPLSASVSEDAERIAAAGSAVTGCRSDVFATHQAQETHREIAQGGHHAWTIPGANLGAVFVIGGIPDVVTAVLNLPMATGQSQQLFGIGFLGGQTGESEGKITTADLAAFPIHNSAQDQEGLAKMGKVHARSLGGDDDFTDFEPTMPDVGGFSAEGGNPPKGGISGCCAVFAGCL